MKRILVLAMALALVAALVVPMVALAADAGDTEISGTIGEVLELTVPAPIVLGAMTVAGSPAHGTSDPAGSVECNHSGGYTVTVQSNNHNGKMVGAATATELGTALSVTTGSLSGVTVIDEVQTCVSKDVAGVTAIPLTVSQVIATTDPADSYSITLTYTAAVK
jgi:hypothetical protein